MKTNQSHPAMNFPTPQNLLRRSHRPPLCQIRIAVLAAWCGVGCLLLASCQSSNPPPAPPVTRAQASQHWVKVASNPPTFFPRGVSSDCPTDFQSGEWVMAGDPAGTRYFIPFQCPGRVPRRDLIHAALALRSDEKLQQVAAEDRQSRSRFLKAAPVLVPLNVLRGMAGGGLIGESELEEMTGRWKDEWSSSKEPKPTR
jgi:hypothetical protein